MLYIGIYRLAIILYHQPKEKGGGASPVSKTNTCAPSVGFNVYFNKMFVSLEHCCLSVCLSIRLSIHPTEFLCLFVSICQSVFLSIYLARTTKGYYCIQSNIQLTIKVSIHPCHYLPVHLSVCLCLSIWQERLNDTSARPSPMSVCLSMTASQTENRS